MRKYGKAAAGILIACTVLQGSMVFADVTMYAPDGRTLTVPDSEVGAYEAVGWYREPPYLMYAADGRTLYVNQSEIGAYEAVGWYREPVRTVYAKDGRTLAIPQSETAAYQNVGWFLSQEEAYYNGVIDSYNAVMAVQDYNGAIKLCADALNSGVLVPGSIFHNDITAKRRAVADTWRNSISCPIGVSGYTMGSDSIGNPEVHINFTNLSYQPISAFKLTFECYDAFGNPARWTSYSSNLYEGYMNNLQLAAMDNATYYWTLYLQDSTTNIRNLRIQEIVFADGSKWVG